MTQDEFRFWLASQRRTRWHGASAADAVELCYVDALLSGADCDLVQFAMYLKAEGLRPERHGDGWTLDAPLQIVRVGGAD